jgi:hypothetical protein
MLLWLVAPAGMQRHNAGLGGCVQGVTVRDQTCRLPVIRQDAVHPARRSPQPTVSRIEHMSYRYGFEQGGKPSHVIAMPVRKSVSSRVKVTAST